MTDTQKKLIEQVISLVNLGSVTGEGAAAMIKAILSDPAEKDK